MSGRQKTQYSEKYTVQGYGNINNGYENCIENYMEYYSRRGKKYKRLYYFFTVIKLLATTSIPVIEIIFGDNTNAGWVIVLSSAIAIFSESIIEKFKMKEKYLSYRSTCDKLGSEQRMFKTRCGYYKGKKDPLNKYVKRIEMIIELENGTWKEYMEKQENERVG